MLLTVWIKMTSSELWAGPLMLTPPLLASMRPAAGVLLLGHSKRGGALLIGGYLSAVCESPHRLGQGLAVDEDDGVGHSCWRMVHGTVCWRGGHK